MALRRFEDVKFCHTCLSTDRILTPITEYKKICDIIFHSFQLICPLDDMFLCWECSALLKNLGKFLNRVEKVQDVLLNHCVKKGFGFVKSLSKLTTTLITDYENIKHEEKLELNTVQTQIMSNPETKENNEEIFNSMKEDLEVAIKQEDNIVSVKDEMIEVDVSTEELDIYNEVNDEDIQVSQNDKEYRNVKEEKCMNENRIGKTCKYKIIERKKCKNNYRKIYIKPEELEFWLKQARENPEFIKSKRKCDKCIIWFKSKKSHDQHIKKHNQLDKSLPLVCDICDIRSSRKKNMRRHCIKHFIVNECCICFYQCHGNQAMYKHFRKEHCRRFECLKCGLTFELLKDFRKHYREMHAKFQCDYCGKETSTKEFLQKHILSRHTTAHCASCNITFKSQWTLLMHNRYKHLPNPTESAYCVECDLQLPNELMYRRHINYSVKHTQKHRSNKGVKCPECGKMYVRKTFMMNHYRHVHLKKTNYYCQICDKYFLNATRIKIHHKTVHQKVPKTLNEICNICGRGFHTRRTLVNHVRTHTGERPNACPHCPARFVQKYAMQTHVRNIHRAETNLLTQDCATKVHS